MVPLRILSGFHDYYDTAQGLGHDPSLLYRREVDVKVVLERELDPRVAELFSLEVRTWGFQPVLAVIGFCGRLYPVYLAPWFALGVESLTSKLPRSPVLTPKELDQYYDEAIRDWHSSRWVRRFGSGQARFWDVLERAGVPASAETFRLVGAPIWLAQRAEWRGSHLEKLRVYTNPRLANLDFQRHFDAYAAFQEIAMYLGSVLKETDDSVRTVGGDAVVAAQKGFGPESFRSSAPSARKQRRKQNRARKKREVGE